MQEPFDMSFSCEYPLKLGDENDDVDMDNIDAYLYLEDEYHDLSMLDGTGQLSNGEMCSNLYIVIASNLL